MPLQIGPYQLKNRILLAPMAGITDYPFREVCRQFGAGLTTAEMVASDPSLIHTKKTQLRLLCKDEPEPRSAQIVGTNPKIMAQAAVFNVNNGAHIIDINMGCPAKKVCNTAAGSALMRDPKLVKKILLAIVKAVNVPVTLKIRTGWENTQKNAILIAQIAEECGIACLVVHGRTKSQAYTGFAEYETIRQVKQMINIPVIANGDVLNAEDAQFIFEYTNADGLMLGRVTHGQPWIIKEFNQKLNGNTSNSPPFQITYNDKFAVILKHIHAIHRYYGTDQGVRIARKHIGWYLYNLLGDNPSLLKNLKKEIFIISDAVDQITVLSDALDQVGSTLEME